MSTVVQRLRRRWSDIQQIALALSEGDVLVHVNRIKGEYETPILTPGRERDLLNDIEEKLNSLDEALRELEDIYPELHLNIVVDFDNDFLNIQHELTRFRHRINEARPTSVPDTGGSRRLERKTKERAARSSYKLLKQIGAEPTAPRGGKWLKLTAILFEVATGLRAGDVSYACVAVFEECRTAPEESEEIPF
jgi:hypothetical protein